MAKKRTLEDPSETVFRLQQMTANVQKKRASETPSETVFRLQQTSVNIADLTHCTSTEHYAPWCFSLILVEFSLCQSVHSVDKV